MIIRRSSRFVFSILAAGVLVLGAAACSSDGDDDSAPVGEVVDDGGSGEPGADVGDTPGAEGSDDSSAGSGGGNVTATYQPARGTASIDDIEDECDWIDVSEVESMTSSDLTADGFGVPGMDLQCEYESDDGQVWVQMAYKLAEPGLDLTDELNPDIPTIEWVEELDGVGEQAVVLEGPMVSAQADIVDGDLWVMANVIVGDGGASGDAERSQQVAIDLALLGIRAG